MWAEEQGVGCGKRSRALEVLTVIGEEVGLRRSRGGGRRRWCSSLGEGGEVKKEERRRWKRRRGEGREMEEVKRRMWRSGRVGGEKVEKMKRRRG
jgi:hypothetical protein